MTDDEKPGRLTISRTDSNQGPSYVSFSLSYPDMSSGDRVDVLVELEMTLEDYALAITGLSRMPVDVKVHKHGVRY